MLKTARNLIFNLLTGANLLAAMLLAASAGSVYANPSSWPTVALLGLAFPVFAATNGCFLLLWLVVCRKRAWLPLTAFAVCGGSLYTYCPVNVPSPHPKGCIKILTFNTMDLGGNLKDENGESVIARYMRDSGADIICFQEGGSRHTWEKNLLPMMDRLPYHDRQSVGHEGNALGCLSRFPIVSSEPITYESDANGSIAYLLELGEGDTLVIVNNHFESNHLTQSDRDRYKDLITNPDGSPVRQSSRLLLTKIRQAGKNRGAQVDSVAAYIDRQLQMGRSVIACGDFNDTPISYACHTLSQRLTDTYRATASGPGFTFNRDGILVRIDHLFCSADWKPYGCVVDRSIRTSDHYPLTCYLKRIPKEKRM